MSESVTRSPIELLWTAKNRWNGRGGLPYSLYERKLASTSVILFFVGVKLASIIGIRDACSIGRAPNYTKLPVLWHPVQLQKQRDIFAQHFNILLSNVHFCLQWYCCLPDRWMTQRVVDSGTGLQCLKRGGNWNDTQHDQAKTIWTFLLRVGSAMNILDIFAAIKVYLKKLLRSVSQRASASFRKFTMQAWWAIGPFCQSVSQSLRPIFDAFPNSLYKTFGS